MPSGDGFGPSSNSNATDSFGSNDGSFDSVAGGDSGFGDGSTSSDGAASDSGGSTTPTRTFHTPTVRVVDLVSDSDSGTIQNFDAGSDGATDDSQSQTSITGDSSTGSNGDGISRGRAASVVASGTAANHGAANSNPPRDLADANQPGDGLANREIAAAARSGREVPSNQAVTPTNQFANTELERTRFTPSNSGSGLPRLFVARGEASTDEQRRDGSQFVADEGRTPETVDSSPAPGNGVTPSSSPDFGAVAQPTNWFAGLWALLRGKAGLAQSIDEQVSEAEKRGGKKR